MAWHSIQAAYVKACLVSIAVGLLWFKVIKRMNGEVEEAGKQ